MAVVIHGAGEQDRTAAERVVVQLIDSWRKVIKLFADGGYQGKLEKKVKKLYGITVEIVKRTFAWIDTNRRNSKYYERLESTGVAMVHLAAIRRMLKNY